MTSRTCPSCGKPADGKFCSNCGAPLSGATCPTCEAPLTAGAHFCHVCGTPLGVRRVHGVLVPWMIAGLAVLVLIMVIAYTVGRSTSPPIARGGVVGGASPSIPGSGGVALGAAPDISNMTPREQADRLFDRIMTAHEEGDAERVAFFLPMALDAYALLAVLDLDARYHVGMIHAIAGSARAALAQADSMEQSSYGHLLASMLRGTVAEVLASQAAVAEAYRRFLDNYDTEIASGRPEYDAHRQAIDAFHQQAQESFSGGS